MALAAARPFTHWALEPPVRQRPRVVAEFATVDYLLEALRVHAEVARVGRSRFSGTLAEKNELWRPARNFLRQALSNIEAAVNVPNRSSALLQYYAALNFAKAELLDTNASDIADRRIGHGLSYNPIRANTVAGDVLKVVPGVFPLLYERRTGQTLPLNTEIPVTRLLAQVPEIATQVDTSGVTASGVGSLIHLVACDASDAWSVLALEGARGSLGSNSVSGRLLRQHYREVAPPPDWRDRFALSRRYPRPPSFFESKQTFPLINGNIPGSARMIVHKLDPILSVPAITAYDAWITPSLYKTKTLLMPASLARYAVAFLASSLVRYKPQMFDSSLHPEQAYLFDAIARELPVPMLIDTLGIFSQEDTLFMGQSLWRL